MNGLKRVTTAALICVILTSISTADQWPHWRGPNADGVGPHGTPPTTWDESTNIKWKVEIPGSGSSTPIVWRDRIYLTTAVKCGKTAYGIKAATIKECSHLLEKDGEFFGSARPRGGRAWSRGCSSRRTAR